MPTASNFPHVNACTSMQAAAGSSRRNESSKAGAVRDLAWVMPEPALLAVAMANGLLLLWDTQGNAPHLILVGHGIYASDLVAFAHLFMLMLSL